MLFQELAEKYIADRANSKYSTLKGYNSILNSHLLPAFGEKNVGEITSSDIRQFQIKLVETLAGSRVNTICQLLRCILAEAQRSNVINIDPSRSVKRVRQRKTKIEPFTEREIDAIFAVVDKHYLPLFQTLLLTGMRPNEAFALTWEDVDFERNTINIDKGLVDGVQDAPKTESSERMIPMVNTLVPVLESIRQASGLVFTNKDGGEIKGDIERIWKKACEQAGVKYRPPYQIRHTYATRAIMRGVNVSYVAKTLGHSTAATTLRFYARWIDNMEHEQNFRQVMS